MKTENVIRSVMGSIICVFFMPAMAQMGDDLPMMMPRDNVKIETIKIGYFTRRLDLTPQEAQNFWPIYNELQAKRETIKKELREKVKSSESKGEMTGKQALELIDAQNRSMQLLTDLHKEYSGKFLAVLPPAKVVKIEQVEREFKTVLLKKLLSESRVVDKPKKK